MCSPLYPWTKGEDSDENCSLSDLSQAAHRAPEPPTVQSGAIACGLKLIDCGPKNYNSNFENTVPISVFLSTPHTYFYTYISKKKDSSTSACGGIVWL